MKRAGNGMTKGWIAAVGAVATVGGYLSLRQAHTPGELTGVPNHEAGATASAVAPAAIRLSSIVGGVTDLDSKPVAGAHVCAALSGASAASTPGLCADADDRGRYFIPGAPSGIYLVTAAHEGFVTGAAHGGEPIALLGDPDSVTVDIVLQPGGAKVAGYVMDATGGPVPHAVVRGERALPPLVAVDVEADDLGRFALWFPPGPMSLTAQAVAYSATRWYGTAPTADVRLILTPGATVRGIVVAAKTGDPLPNMEVRAVPARGTASPVVPSATTGAEGTFDVHGLEPGSYRLVATGEGWQGELAQPVPVGLASTVENIRIEASPGAQVTGHVLVANTRQPCEQGALTFGPLEPNAPPPEPGELPHGILLARPSFSSAIGANGLVHFPAVSAGHYSVSVNCLHNLLREGPRTLDVGSAALSDLIWTVSPGPSLTVLIVDDRDRPMPGVGFVLQRPGRIPASGRTDDAGRYDFSGELSPGTYEVRAMPPFEGERVQVELRDGDGATTATLRLAGTASILATVRDHGGSVVDGLSVAAVAQSSPNADGAAPARAPGSTPSPEPARFPLAMNMFRAMALGEGRYRIAPLKPGRYEVQIGDRANATVRASYTLAAGDALQPTIEIDRGGRIHGHVVDDNGAPVADAWVTADAPARDQSRHLLPMPGGAGRALTDQDGRFVVDHLAGGDTFYTVHVEQPSGNTAAKEGVKVGEADVVVTLHTAGALAGTVDGDCAGPLASIQVMATNLTTDQVGAQQLAGPGQPFRVSVAPGRVRLTAHCSGGAGVAQLMTELRPGEEVSGLHLVLEAPSASQGRSSATQ